MVRDKPNHDRMTERCKMRLGTNQSFYSMKEPIVSVFFIEHTRTV